jgi:type VI protein secretion system component Hcp
MGTRAWLIIKDFYGKGKDLKSELTSFSWGGNQGTQVSGGRNMPRNAVIHDVSMTRQVDDATPQLWSYTASGRPLEKVTVLLEKQVGDSYRRSYSWEFSGVIIISMRTSGSYGGNDTPKETLYLDFANVEFNQSAANDGALGKPDGAQ